jgi:hypothetical protein
MSTRRRGGYLGGSTVIRGSVALPIEKTKEHNAKIQVERERLAAEQRAFEQNKASRLIKADSPEGAKLRVERKAQRRAKHIAQHQRAKLRAERKAHRRSRKPSPKFGAKRRAAISDLSPLMGSKQTCR